MLALTLHLTSNGFGRAQEESAMANRKQDQGRQPQGGRQRQQGDRSGQQGGQSGAGQQNQQGGSGGQQGGGMDPNNRGGEQHNR
jgi:hypothetical protein